MMHIYKDPKRAEIHRTEKVCLDFEAGVLVRGLSPSGRRQRALERRPNRVTHTRRTDLPITGRSSAPSRDGLD